VEAVSLTSGSVFSAVTSEAGLFSVLLPPGRYRLRIAPGAGHDVVRSPGVLQVDPGEIVTDADFVLGGAGLVSQGSAL
jgi:hypothetical protein